MGYFYELWLEYNSNLRICNHEPSTLMREPYFFLLLHYKLRARLDVDCENTYYIISDKPSCYREVFFFLTKINSWKIFTRKPPIFKYGLHFLILLCLVSQKSVITSLSGWIEASHYWFNILKPIIKIIYLKMTSTRRAEATGFSQKNRTCLPDDTASCARGQSLSVYSYFTKTHDNVRRLRQFR